MKNNYWNSLLSFGLISTSVFWAGFGHAGTELAKVNQTVITLEEFNKRYQENLKFFPLKAPPKKDVLEDLIKREVGIQEAKRQELDKNPDVIDRINTILFNALIEKNLSKEVESIHVTDAEAKAYYAKNPLLRTSQIYVGVSLTAKEDDQKAALARIKKIKTDYLDKGVSFAEAAQKHSDGPAAPMGGDMDYLSRDRLDPLYYNTALKLEVEDVSDIIRTPFGYHIIKLTGIRTWEDVDKTLVKRMVFEEQKTKLFNAYMSKLQEQTKVTKNLDLLKGE